MGYFVFFGLCIPWVVEMCLILDGVFKEQQAFSEKSEEPLKNPQCFDTQPTDGSSTLQDSVYKSLKYTDANKP
jgi:hypothetical protein